MTDSLARSGQGGMLASLKLFAGTIGVPGLSWTAETTSGLYRAGAGDFRWAIGGVDVWTIGANGVGFANGTAAAPSIYFTSDTNLGLYRDGVDRLGITTAGVLRVTVSASGLIATTQVSSSGASAIFRLNETDATVDEKIWDIRAEADDFFIQGRDDAGLNPVNYLQMTRTGTAAGVAVWTNTQHRFAAGTAAIPSLSFSGDTNTGVYSIGADSLGISTGGTLRATISTALFEVTTDAMFDAPVTLSDNSITRLLFNTTDALLDEKLWELRSNNAGQFFGFTRTDVDGTGATWLQVDRTGTVVDSVTISGTAVSFTGVLRVADGAVGSPAIGFTSDTDTGFYRVAADAFGITTGGALRFTVGSSAITATLQWQGQNGTAALPAGSFSGDPNTGWYNVGADDFGISTGGTLRFDVSTTAVTSTLALILPVGSAAAPALRFGADTDSGLYQIADNNIGFSFGGTLRFDISSTLITSTLVHVGPAGAVGAPTYSFSGDPNTGVYSVGADTLGITTGGVLRLSASTTDITSTLVLLGPAGAVGAPTYSFSGDPNTGIYSVGADQLGISTNGVLRLTTSTTAFTGTLPWQGQAGSVGTPALSFSTDPNSGMFSVAGDQVGISTNGVLRWDVSTTAITSTLSNQGPAASAATPTWSFFNDPNTGMYSAAADQIGFSAGGTLTAVISATVNAFTAPLLQANGIHNGTAPTGAANQYIASGTYTPTLTNTTNLDASTAFLSQWMRVGNVVTVCARVTVDPTVITTTTVLGMSLPIASAIANAQEIAGTVGGDGVSSSGIVKGDAANDRATLNFISGLSVSYDIYCTFSYLVL
jgi:hypothetical protein